MTQTLLLDTAKLDQAGEDPAQAIPLFRQSLQDSHLRLQQAFHDGAPADSLVFGRCQVMDSLLTRIWHRFVSERQDKISLVAVGGYGRGELHPHSDIDLLILLADSGHEHDQASLEQFLVFLWDIGLEVGHSVRTVAECVTEAGRDITVATNLIESRLLCGPESLYQEMCRLTGPDHLWNSRDFFEAKCREQSSRYHKYDDTAYKLEPNIKEGPGGLRDIHMIGWVAKRHFNARTLYDLVEHEFLTPQEYEVLHTGQLFLWRIRIALHLITGRREDRLLFEHQTTLATQSGYVDDRRHLGVEKFMKEYYRTITELSRLNEMLLQLFQEAILYGDQPAECRSINKRFRIRNDFIEVTHERIFDHYPFALLEIFLLLEQRPDIRGVRAATIRLIRDHRHLIDDRFRQDLRCRSLFMEILRQPAGITHELRRMNRYGILAEYLPVFGNIVGQMQYDLFHIYTVDDHTLMVVRNIRRFTVEQFANEFPFCSELIQRLPKPELLYIAALFHDIAKGRGGDHSELGAEDAIHFCQDHGLSRYDTDLVAWLVRYHLIMSATAQHRDISDPEIIAEFAARVEHQNRLDYLYLLTVADIRGTNPELWNTWKDALLLELYSATRRALKEGPENLATRAQLIDEHRVAARNKLQGDVAPRHIDNLWQYLDDDYFLRHNADEIAWQTRLICHSQPERLPLVMIREETNRGGTEIFVYTRDRDNLFAMITLVLEHMNVTIVDARVVTSQDGYALDTFIVLDASGEAIRDPRRLHEIESMLQEKLRSSDVSSMRITRRLTRHLKHFRQPTRVTFNDDRSFDRTIMAITASDRPGLLARIGLALVECGIRVHSAKIATFGARVEDYFVITDNRDRPLDSAAKRKKLSATIVHYLDHDQDNET